MSYRKYIMLQKYVNGVATEEYKQGELLAKVPYNSYETCMKGNSKPDAPVINTIYQWVNDGTICDGCSKYMLEKQQKSTDGGITWIDTGATRRGDLLVIHSSDCCNQTTNKDI